MSQNRNKGLGPHIATTEVIIIITISVNWFTSLVGFLIGFVLWNFMEFHTCLQCTDYSSFPSLSSPPMLYKSFPHIHGFCLFFLVSHWWVFGWSVGWLVFESCFCCIFETVSLCGQRQHVEITGIHHCTLVSVQCLVGWQR